MADKKYYWLKLKDDFFTLKEIKKLRKIAGGDTYTIIYLKLQLLSLKNEGKILFEGIEDTFAEEIALILDEDPENVKMTLLFLQKVGLMEEVTDVEFLLPQAVQSIGCESSVAERVRKHRENLKMLQCNTNVTPIGEKRNTEKEIEKEIEIEKDIYIHPSAELTPYKQIQELFNSICISLPKIKSFTNNRKKTFSARWKENPTIEFWDQVFYQVQESDFLSGRSGTWQCSFDWIIKPVNLQKIIEGNYKNKMTIAKQHGAPQKSSFSNFQNRQYESGEILSLEEQLLARSRKDMADINSR